MPEIRITATTTKHTEDEEIGFENNVNNVTSYDTLSS